MSPIWDDAPQPMSLSLTLRDRLRMLRRGLPMALVVTVGLALLLLARLVERPLCGARRPVTPWVTQAVCLACLRLLGLRRITRGAPMPQAGAVVANHVSWLDIFALNAGDRIYFVSKSEVAGWPGIGWLARATGTLFIRRDPREASTQTATFGTRLQAGHRLLFFPEGTSTDGLRVLPFKTTLFAAFLSPGLPAMAVQPVTLRYVAPDGARPDFYGWWGGRSFGAHLVATLAERRQGHVEVTYHPPLTVRDFPDRKALARAAEAAVRRGLDGKGRHEFAKPRDRVGR